MILCGHRTNRFAENGYRFNATADITTSALYLCTVFLPNAGRRVGASLLQVDIITEEFLYLQQNQHRSSTQRADKEGSPAQHRVFSILRRTILYVGPALQEFLVQHHSCQFAGYGAVYVLDDGEVCGEEDVEVALLDLSQACISRIVQAKERCNAISLRVAC